MRCARRVKGTTPHESVRGITCGAFDDARTTPRSASDRPAIPRGTAPTVEAVRLHAARLHARAGHTFARALTHARGRCGAQRLAVRVRRAGQRAHAVAQSGARPEARRAEHVTAAREAPRTHAAFRAGREADTLTTTLRAGAPAVTVGARVAGRTDPVGDEARAGTVGEVADRRGRAAFARRALRARGAHARRMTDWGRARAASRTEARVGCPAVGPLAFHADAVLAGLRTRALRLRGARVVAPPVHAHLVAGAIHGAAIPGRAALHPRVHGWLGEARHVTAASEEGRTHEEDEAAHGASVAARGRTPQPRTRTQRPGGKRVEGCTSQPAWYEHRLP